MSSRLVANKGRWHTYSLDGKRVPGVTTICGAMNKGALPNAAAKEVALWCATHVADYDSTGSEEWLELARNAHRRVWDKSMKDGTRLHLIAERLVYGEPVPDEDPDGLPWADDVRRMGEQVARFMDAWDVAPLLVEQPVFHGEHRWAGTPDLVANLRGGERWLIDYKTGQSGIWPEIALQLAAYGQATHVSLGDEDRPFPAVTRYAGLWVRPDFWQLQPVHVNADTYRVFRALQYVQPFTQLKREQVIGPALAVPEEVAS
jgi:hypothetical protein